MTKVETSSYRKKKNRQISKDENYDNVPSDQDTSSDESAEETLRFLREVDKRPQRLPLFPKQPGHRSRY